MPTPRWPSAAIGGTEAPPAARTARFLPPPRAPRPVSSLRRHGPFAPSAARRRLGAAGVSSTAGVRPGTAGAPCRLAGRRLGSLGGNHHRNRPTASVEVEPMARRLLVALALGCAAAHAALAAAPQAGGAPTARVRGGRAPTPLKLRKNRRAKGGAHGFGVARGTRETARAAGEEEIGSKGRLNVRFMQWLADAGALANAVEVADCGGGLRGLRATCKISAGEVIMKIPRNVILDVTHAESSPVCALWHGDAPSLPGYAKMALALLYEKRLGNCSFLAPYIDLLPTPSEFEEAGGPAATWTDDELAVTECEKLVEDARKLRERMSGADINFLTLIADWKDKGLPGEPPDPHEFAWAVTVTTSRAYKLQTDFSADVIPNSGLIPLVDMANHDGRLTPHTAKGLDGDSFVVVATSPIRKGEQIFLSYGAVPNFMLLEQWGFVLPNLEAPPDVALVDIGALIRSEDEPALKALIELAEAGKLMRNRDGSVSAWQPAGETLDKAITSMPALAAVFGSSSGNDTYRLLLRHTLDKFSTTVGEDNAELTTTPPPLPRRRLALQFRIAQKALLNQELSASMQRRM